MLEVLYLLRIIQILGGKSMIQKLGDEKIKERSEMGEGLGTQVIQQMKKV